MSSIVGGSFYNMDAQLPKCRGLITGKGKWKIWRQKGNEICKEVDAVQAVFYSFKSDDWNLA